MSKKVIRAHECGYRGRYTQFCNHPDVRAALKDLPHSVQWHDCGLHPNAALGSCLILFPKTNCVEATMRENQK